MISWLMGSDRPLLCVYFYEDGNGGVGNRAWGRYAPWVWPKDPCILYLFQRMPSPVNGICVRQRMQKACHRINFKIRSTPTVFWKFARSSCVHDSGQTPEINIILYLIDQSFLKTDGQNVSKLALHGTAPGELI